MHARLHIAVVVVHSWTHTLLRHASRVLIQLQFCSPAYLWVTIVARFSAVEMRVGFYTGRLICMYIW